MYTISKTYDKETILALIELIRDISRNNAPFVLALHTVLITGCRLHLTSRIALYEGMLGLFKEIVETKQLIPPQFDYKRLFEFSRPIFSALLKLVLKHNPPPLKWSD